ncbi:MAG: proton-conducting transporter membrane subunit [bacterium]
MMLNLNFLPIDPLSLFMLFIVLILFPMVFLFSLAYVKRNYFRYFSVFFITFLAMLGAVLAKDFLSFYIFLEVMIVGIYFLIIDNTKKESFPAGFKYILMMFIGGIFVLVASLMLYNLTGTFSMAEISLLVPALPRQTLLPIFVLFTIGCLIEIGAVPFHVWLPDAHPVAPSPISALLSGVAIKIGAYALIRLIITLQMNNVILMWLGIISMIFGVLLAMRQTNVKRLLAYSSISQMGYILLGIGVGTGIGLGGAMFHILNHAIFKMLLFLCMGAVIFSTREREFSRLGGLGKQMPVTFAAFCVGALAISGIPPFNGFASKALISEAVAGNIYLKIALVLTAAGTFATFLKLYFHVFLGCRPKTLKKIKPALFLMKFPLFMLALLSLLVGLFPNIVLTRLIEPIAKFNFTYHFWQPKLLVETPLMILLGIIFYYLGMKSGFMRLKGEDGATYFSFDRFYVGLAVFVEKFSFALRKFLARDLNVYLRWIFLTLVLLLAFFWVVI